ncbi:MAG: CBS domain-containing protein [Haliscomenobacter sp.]
MIAEQLITDAIAPLKITDSGEMALDMMSEFGVRHLPLVKDGLLIGVISEEDALNADLPESLDAYPAVLPRPYVRTGDHIYEIIHVLSRAELTLVPVLDSDQKYVGCITLETLFFQFSKMASFSEPGCIVVLEMNKRDYSLTEISRIVESEQTSVLSAFVTSYPDSPRMEVTLKLNRQNIQYLLNTFERFKYTVKAVYQETESLEELRERYDALISYLNV